MLSCLLARHTKGKGVTAGFVPLFCFFPTVTSISMQCSPDYVVHLTTIPYHKTLVLPRPLSALKNTSAVGFTFIKPKQEKCQKQCQDCYLGEEERQSHLLGQVTAPLTHMPPPCPPGAPPPVPRLLTSPVQTPMANTIIHFTASYLRPFCSHRERQTQVLIWFCQQQGSSTSWLTSLRLNFTETASLVVVSV